MKLVILHKTVESETNLINSFQNDCIIKNAWDFNNIDDLFQSLTNISNFTHIAFVYHYSGYTSVPFYPDNYIPVEDSSGIQINQSSKYFYISDNIINFIKKFNNITIDLLSCNITDSRFIDEVNKIKQDIGVEIRYSLNQTGNNPEGDWILESHNIDIRNIYFTNSINQWTNVLNGDHGANIRNGTDTLYATTGYITYDSSTKTFKLTQNINWVTILWSHYDCFIELQRDEIFDGQGYTISVPENPYHQGLFSISTTTNSPTNLSNAPLIKNLGIIGGNSLAGDAGFIIRPDQKYFKIKNCYSTGGYTDQAGGICGRRAGYQGECLIENCYSTGSGIGNNGGGICGAGAGFEGICTINNCFATGNTPTSGGGIVGGHAGGTEYIGAVIANSESKCIIKNCYHSGTIGAYGGGIAGRTPGLTNGTYQGLCLIQNCYSINSSGFWGGSIGGWEYINTDLTENGNPRMRCIVQNTFSSRPPIGNDEGQTYKTAPFGTSRWPPGGVDANYSLNDISGGVSLSTSGITNARFLNTSDSYSTYTNTADAFIETTSSYPRLEAFLITPWNSTKYTIFDPSSGSPLRPNYFLIITPNFVNDVCLNNVVITYPPGSDERIIIDLSNNISGISLGTPGVSGTINSLSNLLVFTLEPSGTIFSDYISMDISVNSTSNLIVYYNTGASTTIIDDSSNNSTTPYFIDLCNNSIKFFTKSFSDIILGNQNGGLGDPFIKPIFGASYYLPNDESTYLLFDNKDNLKLYTKTWFAPNIVKMSFMRYLIFEFNDNRACFDLETFKWFKIDNQAKYLSHSLDVELGDILFDKLRITNKNKKSIRDYYGKRFSPSIENKVIEIEFFLEKQNIRLEIIRDLKYKDIRNNVNFIINGSIDRETLSKYNGSFISEYNVRKVNNNVFFNKNICIN